MLDRLAQIEARYEELGSQLADPEIVNDQARYQKTAKRIATSKRLWTNTGN